MVAAYTEANARVAIIADYAGLVARASQSERDKTLPFQCSAKGTCWRTGWFSLFNSATSV
jgi:hypothetical protein